jgi:hypothetical protein
MNRARHAKLPWVIAWKIFRGRERIMDLLLQEIA